MAKQGLPNLEISILDIIDDVLREEKISKKDFIRAMERANEAVQGKNYEKTINQVKPFNRPVLEVNFNREEVKTRAQAIMDYIDRTIDTELAKVNERAKKEKWNKDKKYYERKKRQRELYNKFTNIKDGSYLDMVARTEITGSLNKSRAQAMDNIKEVNPNMRIWKVWNHKGSDDIGYMPRLNHLRMNGVRHKLKTLFRLPTDNGVVQCSGPYDPSLPVGEIVNCRCILDYYVEA